MNNGDLDLTGLLARYRAGDGEAFNHVLHGCAQQLRRVAAALLRNERDAHTWQPTALVNETVIRLLNGRARQWSNRAEFFAGVSLEMRRALTDYARRRLTNKRGNGLTHLSLDDVDPTTEHNLELLLALEQAFQQLLELSPRSASVVELKAIVGLTTAEAAAALGVTTRTIERDWAWGLAHLYGRLRGSTSSPGQS